MVYEVSKLTYITWSVSIQRVILPVAGVIEVCVCNHGCLVYDGYVVDAICNIVRVLPEVYMNPCSETVV